MKRSVNEFNSRSETSKEKDSEIEGRLVELSNLKKKEVKRKKSEYENNVESLSDPQWSVREIKMSINSLRKRGNYSEKKYLRKQYLKISKIWCVC